MHKGNQTEYHERYRYIRTYPTTAYILASLWIVRMEEYDQSTCGSILECDARWIWYALCRTHDWPTVARRND
jgi:hypothetical protein